MCLIYTRHAAHAGKRVPKEYLDTSITRNKDGVGVMYTIKGKDGKSEMVVEQMMGTKEEQLAFINKHETISHTKGWGVMACHMRMRTQGATDTDNLHPFKIMSREEGYQKDLWMMHNGTINGFGTSTGKSDTSDFAEQLAPLLQRKPTLLNEPFFMKLLENMVGGHGNFRSKLVFMDNFGKIYYANKDAGKEIDGIWYSNTYSLPDDGIANPKKVVTTIPKQVQSVNTSSTTTTAITTAASGKTSGKTVKVGEVYLPEKVHDELPRWLRNRHGSVKTKYHTIIEFLHSALLDPKATIDWTKWSKIAQEDGFQEHLKQLAKADTVKPTRPVLTVVANNTKQEGSVNRGKPTLKSADYLLEQMKKLWDNDELMSELDFTLFHDKQFQQQTCIDLLDDGYNELMQKLGHMQNHELADLFLYLMGSLFETHFNYEATGLYETSEERTPLVV